MFFYAVANVVLDLKLKQYNRFVLMFGYSIFIFTTACIGRYILQPLLKLPGSTTIHLGSDLGWMAFLGVLFALADVFYVGAYTDGGNLITVTAISLLFPVFSNLIQNVWVRNLPNGWQVLGYTLGVLAMLAVGYGSSIKK